jgi:DNA-damage-inducible protein D
MVGAQFSVRTVDVRMQEPPLVCSPAPLAAKERNMSQPTPRVNPFEAIKHHDEDGNEFWSARELGKVLGYDDFFNFKKALARAAKACEKSGHAPTDHFLHVKVMVTIGSGAKRQVEDYHLSRYACYLVVENADPEKEVVALGQAYFAVQTRRMELHDAEVEGMTEDQRRLLRRKQYTEYYKSMAHAAFARGIVTPEDFQTFIVEGHPGLYGGERRPVTEDRKGLKKGERIADRSNSGELAANILFYELSCEALEEDDSIETLEQATQVHYQIGKEIHDTIVRLGRTPPEKQPTPKRSIKEVERDEKRRQAKGMDLWPDIDAIQ